TDVGAAVACVVAQLSKKGVQDTELAKQLGEARSQVNYSGTEVPPSPAPVPGPFTSDAVKAGVAEAKALLANLRSNAQTSTTDALQDRLHTVGLSFDQVGALVGDRMVNAITTMTGAANRLAEPRLPYASSFMLGDASCFYHSDVAGTVEAKQPAAVKSVRCVTDVDWDYQGTTSSASSNGQSEYLTTYFIKSVVLVLTPGATAGQVNVVSRMVQRTRVDHWVYTPAVFDPNTGALVKPSSSSSSTVVTNVQRLSADFTTTLTRQANGAGQLTQARILGDLAPLSMSHLDQSESLDVSLNVGAQGAFTRIDLTGTIKAIRPGLTAAVVKFSDPSYVLVRSAVPGDLASDSPDDQSGASASLHIAMEGDDGSTADGVLTLSLDHLQVAQEVGRGQASFRAILRNAQQAVLFDGTVKVLAPTNVTSAQSGAYQDATLEVDGKLAMLNGRPDLSVHLAMGMDYTVDRVIKGQYVQGSDTVLLTAKVAGSGELQSISVSTPSGIAATYLPEFDTFNLLKGTDLLGVVDVKKGRVDYVDSTFELY
ncbi:MAG: hypothetical protein RI907_3430, partial [Pseudomonadota bacterium]